MSVRVLIAGCGYLGAALAARLAREGSEVVALRRRPGGLPAGVRPFAANLAEPASLRPLPGPFDAVVYAAAPDGRSEAAYRAVYETGVANLLAAARCERFVLVSSTSVYGQDAGEWVDESSAAEARGFAGRSVRAGEALARERHGAACAVRLGGLYGPGRSRLLRAARAGDLAYQPAPPHYTNRIHRDDAAGALAHLLNRPRLEPVYVGVDCEPAAEEPLQRWLAARVGGAPPRPRVGPAGGAGKRCSNRLLLAAGYRFRFPTFREGYGALADAEPGDGPAADQRGSA
jgi:nucleoside-diphosphate-sugar epimerase